MTSARGLPVILQTEGRRCVVVGCGPVGARKARAIVASGADVVVVEPRALPKDLAEHVDHLHRRFEPGDAAGALLVVAATNDESVNAAVDADARANGALVLRADAPGGGHVRSPAVYRSGRVTVAVDSGGAGPALATHIRDEIAEHDRDWGRLAEWAAEQRPLTRTELAERAAEHRAPAPTTEPSAERAAGQRAPAPTTEPPAERVGGNERTSG